MRTEKEYLDKLSPDIEIKNIQYEDTMFLLSVSIGTMQTNLDRFFPLHREENIYFLNFMTDHLKICEACNIRGRVRYHNFKTKTMSNSSTWKNLIQENVYKNVETYLEYFKFVYGDGYKIKIVRKQQK